MFYGLIALLASIVILIMAERCRRMPCTCKDGFMGENGATRSFVALRFLGKAAQARDAIVNDPRLRKHYLWERYLLAAVGMIVGILLIVFS